MERDFVRWLSGRGVGHPAVQVGIGDDAAVLRPEPGRDWVVTTDMLMDGVDFELAKVDPRRVGRKALAVNLSDLAAMAAKPVAAFVSVALPQVGGLKLAQELHVGLQGLAEEFGTCIAGGDTNSWRGPLVISVTALGTVDPAHVLLRSGARPGDAILVTGPLGGSILGKHFDFTPRVREAQRLVQLGPLHAGIDLSDGLSLDLFRLIEASGCGAELDLAQIPISPAARELAARGTGKSPLEHALSDGEDFELLLSVPAEFANALVANPPAGVTLFRIGTILPEPGLWGVSPNGDRVPLVPQGYEHSLS